MCGISCLTARQLPFSFLTCHPASLYSTDEELAQDKDTLALPRLLKTVEQEDFHQACAGLAAESVSEGDQAGQQGLEQEPRCRLGTHQDGNGFGQGPTGLEAFLSILYCVLPLQAHCREGPACSFLALGVEDEAVCDLVLHSWPGREGRTDFWSAPQEHEPDFLEDFKALLVGSMGPSIYLSLLPT